ncbi:hypothetical protein CPB84DRAFT_1813866 [Gymnopilus junonius]|uniref:CCZ1/INTU/HSP4 first Longin domain-containing protein n=1 Tax=Gymnopilus junonius TaxID=109634 RepID=A0A9P5NWH9_GYMJU|nr:hypothetical protein CPB84DRAFT_1813866 [Gymnopilus junonius]
MNRIPPNLLYLTIYNPTLKPSGPIEGDSEDAEEQAHILFYTSRERAVSRDRMLRQIGLAKALINFAELFNSDNPCDNVHSQSSRMIMVSPEPNFWIHAVSSIYTSPIEIVDSKNKSKSESKPTDKGKEKETSPVYEYDDGSVHDSALRAHILQGYERFKLTHGSFTSIMSNLGQQALELQLERFWTVWAWSWDLEKKIEFGEDLGPLLHPCFSAVIPILNEFSNNLSIKTTPVALSRKHIIPSSRYTEGRYPAALAAHLSSMIPPVQPSRSSDTLNTLASSVDTIKGKRSSESKSAPNTNAASSVGFLGIPSVTVNMDPKKWNWPGYLTFGKGSSAKPPVDKLPGTEPKDSQDAGSVSTVKEQEASRLQVEVNAEDLEDAMTSDSLSTASKPRNSSNVVEGGEIAERPELNDPPAAIVHSTEADVMLKPTDSKALSSNLSNLSEEMKFPSPPPYSEFTMTNLNLSSAQDPTSTKRVAIHYFIRTEFMLALINNQDDAAVDEDDDAADLQIASEKATKLLDDLESTIYHSSLQNLTDSLPSATKILQTQDRYLISTGQYTHGSPDFSSTSSHLFNARAILDLDHTYTEVFSRGQNPQHWHIVKRGMSSTQIHGSENAGHEEAVFMEVFRKEASLTDVDNVLVAVVKKSGLVDSGPSSISGSR